MGLKVWLFCAIACVLAVVTLEIVIKLGVFVTVYPHQPGRCKTFHMTGSEDMTLLPNKQIIISSGFHGENEGTKAEPALYVLDMNNAFEGPKKLRVDFLAENSDSLYPHGINSWITEEGNVLLYLIVHWEGNKDSVEVFQYSPPSLIVKHLRSLRHELLYELNSLVLVGEDEFFTSSYHHFHGVFLHTIEALFRLPIMHMTYFNGRTGEGRYAATGLKNANGLGLSNNKRYVYLSNLGASELIAFRRNPDNTLTSVQTFPVIFATDNLFVDPTNGHIWMGSMPQAYKTGYHLKNTSVLSPGKVMHMMVDEESPLPFSKSRIEAVFTTTGEDISAISVATYHNHTLAIGSVMSNLVVCEVHYLMFD